MSEHCVKKCTQLLPTCLRAVCTANIVAIRRQLRPCRVFICARYFSWHENKKSRFVNGFWFWKTSVRSFKMTARDSEPLLSILVQPVTREETGNQIQQQEVVGYDQRGWVGLQNQHVALTFYLRRHSHGQPASLDANG